MTSTGLKPVWIGVIYAFVLWTLMFGARIYNFWALMVLATTTLSVWSIYNDHEIFARRGTWLKTILLGVGSAILLYLVFYSGDQITKFLPFQDGQVVSIYDRKSESPGWLIGILLMLIIGPGEEIFWRGFVQKRFGASWGGNTAFIVTALLYTLVHVPSLNLMLIGASAVCGLFWGLLYRFTGSAIPGIISHALWDVGIFVVFPMR